MQEPLKFVPRDAELEVTPEYAIFFTAVQNRIEEHGKLILKKDGEELKISISERGEGAELFASYSITGVLNDEKASLHQAFFFTRKGVVLYSAELSSSLLPKRLNTLINTEPDDVTAILGNETIRSRKKRQKDSSALEAVLLKTYDRLKEHAINNPTEPA